MIWSMTPFRALGLAIIQAADQCRERMKPFDTTDIEMYVFYEFLYFFMHMTDRAADSQGFTNEQIEKLQQGVYPDVITAAIDSFMLHWAEELKARFRSEFYDNLNSAEIEYSTSKELMSKEWKPLSGQSLLAKLSRKVAAKMDKGHNPEVLMQATRVALEKLKEADLLKLVGDTKSILRSNS